jgi:hypothetical protein
MSRDSLLCVANDGPEGWARPKLQPADTQVEDIGKHIFLSVPRSRRLPAFIVFIVMSVVKEAPDNSTILFGVTQVLQYCC